LNNNQYYRITGMTAGQICNLVQTTIRFNGAGRSNLSENFTQGKARQGKARQGKARQGK